MLQLMRSFNFKDVIVFYLRTDVDIQPLPALTYRTIGGVLDFFVFTGPSPDSVVEQYTDVILKPFMPPYWALGFHLCRYEYPDSTVMKKVIERNRAIGIPYVRISASVDYETKLNCFLKRQQLSCCCQG